MNASHDSDATTTNDIISALSAEYATEQVPCDPGDTAFKITKQESNISVYLISFHDPYYIEIITFDGDETVSQTFLYRKNKTVEKCAYIVRSCF